MPRFMPALFIALAFLLLPACSASSGGDNNGGDPKENPSGEDSEAAREAAEKRLEQIERYKKDLDSKKTGIALRAVRKLAAWRAVEAVGDLILVYKFGKSEKMKHEIVRAFGVLITPETETVLTEALSHVRVALDKAGGVRQAAEDIFKVNKLDFGFRAYFKDAADREKKQKLVEEFAGWWNKNREKDLPLVLSSVVAFADEKGNKTLIMSALGSIESRGFVESLPVVYELIRNGEEGPVRTRAIGVFNSLTLRDFEPGGAKTPHEKSEAGRNRKRYYESGAWKNEKDLLTAALGDATARNRATAVGRLAKIEEDWASGLLVDVLEDESSGVRARAYRVLAYRFRNEIPPFNADAGGPERAVSISAVKDWWRGKRQQK